MTDRATIIGLDLALTATGVALLHGAEAPSAATLDPGSLRGVKRLVWYRGALDTCMVDLEGARPGLCVVEGYSFASKNGREAAGELGCVLRLLCHDAGVPLLVVPPSTLKKYVTGKGTADKAQMMLRVYQRWGFDPSDDHQADAYALAQFGRESLAGPDTQTKAFKALLGKTQMETA